MPDFLEKGKVDFQEMVEIKSRENRERIANIPESEVKSIKIKSKTELELQYMPPVYDHVTGKTISFEQYREQKFGLYNTK